MKRVYVDMDDVLADYLTEWRRRVGNKPAQGFPQAEVDFFRSLEPIPGAIEGIKTLAEHYDTWILTRPSVYNPMSYTEKRLWVEDHLGFEWCERLILCPDKKLVIGDYLVDDMPWPEFQGEQLQFGARVNVDRVIDWGYVLEYLECV